VFKAARWRLVAWNVAVFSILLMILGVVAYRAFSVTIYNNVDQQLRERQINIERELGAAPQSSTDAVFIDDPSLTQGPFRILVGDTTGFINYSPTDCPQPAMFTNLPCAPNWRQPTSQQAIYAALAHGGDLRTAYFHGTAQRVLTFVYHDPTQAGDPPLYTFQISHDASGEVAALENMRLLLFFGGLFGVALAALGSLFLANRALVPIRQAFTRQRQFTADASHELRTPLALIRANAEMLTMHHQRLAAEDSELVGEIIRETDHLNRLVGDLLTLARADTETPRLQLEPVDFRSLVEEVHEDLHRVAEFEGIDTSLTLNGPVSVTGDETRLRQLLLILLDNAVKYTDPGGHVDVSVQRENGHARLVVTDTGIGIPAKDLPRIFDRFYRVDQARGHESGGTGLGLAIAKWIVQAHHGTIRVESQEGQGTRFLVDLPSGRDASGSD